MHEILVKTGCFLPLQRLQVKKYSLNLYTSFIKCVAETTHLTQGCSFRIKDFYVVTDIH